MQLRRWCNWLVSSFAFVCRNVNCPTICNTALFYEEDGEQCGLQKLLKLLLIVLDYFLNMPTSELSVNFLCRASFFTSRQYYYIITDILGYVHCLFISMTRLQFLHRIRAPCYSFVCFLYYNFILMRLLAVVFEATSALRVEFTVYTCSNY